MLYHDDSLVFQILSVNRMAWGCGKFHVLPRPYGALAFRVEGSGKFTAQGQNISTERGDILFLPAGIEYDVEYTAGKIIVIHFSSRNYASGIENYRFLDPRLFYEKFIEILNLWESHASVYAVNAAVYLLLDAMRADKKKESIVEPLFLECVAQINAQYTDPGFTIARVCQHSGISESNLRKQFHHFIGISPKQYLLQLRFNKAVKLLAEDSNTVSEIAELCGFGDEKYFSRVIRQKYGESPSVLRRRFRL